MPSHVLTFECLLISPGDVEEERNAIEETVGAWNGHVGRGLNARVEIRRWESHARPAMGQPPQDTLNAQLVDGCDFGLAVFWSRLGSPTANHPSGSAEEVERILANGGDVMVYFSEKPIPQAALRDDQFQRLQKLKDEYAKRGLYSTFDSTAKLRELVALHLTSLVSGRLTQVRAEGQPIPSTGTLTAPKPDVRVSVAAGVAGWGDETVPIVTVRIENHSPVDFFFAGVSFTLKGTESRLAVFRDALHGTPIMPMKIAPGDAHSVHFDPSEDHGQFNAADIVNVYATDKIGRNYVAPPGEMASALKGFADWQKTIAKKARSRR